MPKSYITDVERICGRYKENDVKLLKLIERYKVEYCKTDADLAKAAGISSRSIGNRKVHPERFSIRELRLIFHCLKVPQDEILRLFTAK